MFGGLGPDADRRFGTTANQSQLAHFSIPPKHPRRFEPPSRRPNLRRLPLPIQPHRPPPRSNNARRPPRTCAYRVSYEHVVPVPLVGELDEARVISVDPHLLARGAAHKAVRGGLLRHQKDPVVAACPGPVGLDLRECVLVHGDPAGSHTG